MDKELKEKAPRQGDDKRRHKNGKDRHFRKGQNLPSKLSMNDPYWYVLHPELLKDAASLPFSHFFGKGFDLRYSGSPKARESTVFKINYLYTLGVCNNATDPANLAIRNLYTFVRHQNSGHTNYESADLGIYLFATAAVVATLAHIERCIGVAKYYQRRSSIVPAALLSQLGVSNVPAFISNLANYTLKLNTMWSRVSSLCIPKDFSFLKRWVWMNSQVFKDHESDKAALYVFKPIGVPVYQHFTLDAGSISQPTDEAATPTIDDWFNDASTALDAILEDEDMNIMSGDILKAYGKENLLEFGMTPLDYVVEPVYVEEMLPQIQHLQCAARANNNGFELYYVATGISYDTAQAINDPTNSIYTAASDPDYFTIYQYNGVVICQPVHRAGSTTSPIISSSTNALCWDSSGVNNSVVVNNENRIITSCKESVPPEDVMIATRLMYVSEVDTRAGLYYEYITSCGSEIVQSVTVMFTESTNPNFQSLEFGTIILFDSGSAAQALLTLNTVNLISQFDWSPITYVSSIATGTITFNRYVFGDVDNFTVISPTTLAGLNLTALLAEFSVSQYNLIKG